MSISFRSVVRASFTTTAVLLTAGVAVGQPLPGGSLNPTSIPQFVRPMVIPPAMPLTSTINAPGGVKIDYYEIAVRQFKQEILPPSLPKTTVWGYGSVNHSNTFNYPAFTIEADYNRPVRVKWINGLVDSSGHYLPHLLSVDQTLHWANPPGPRDEKGLDPEPYTGPVPMIVHVHGADTEPASDGYPEAWYMPDVPMPPDVQYSTGSLYSQYKTQAESAYGQTWTPGTAVFQYPNTQRATTLWYHDHTLGMTRLNVYAGPAGFYLLRGGPGDEVMGSLPAPWPKRTDKKPKKYHEIPIAIQDRSFNSNGSLFYPADRAFFEGLSTSQLQIPFIPDPAIGGMSDISPIWNPEFFGNTMVVNGRTWPYLEVERKQYRFRLLNGCNSRFLILKMSNGMPFVQIGAEGGFLPSPVERTELLIAPAERADVIVDFSSLPSGTNIVLQNIGPDEPFAGGEPGVDFAPADPSTTGRVMQFRVKGGGGGPGSTPAMQLGLPAPMSIPSPNNTRKVSLNEEVSSTVFVSEVGDNVVLNPAGEPFGPRAALLGTVSGGNGVPLGWDAPITENPGLGSTEVWEIYNYTADAHPIHVHLVQFQVLNRQDADGNVFGPEPWETGCKDTVIAYPGEITRIKAKFDRMGLYVWHCHVVEHEDNEMMRPYYVGPMLP